MAAVNSRFKGVFIFFNVIFGVAAVLLLGLGSLAHTLYHPSEVLQSKMSAVFLLYFIGGATLVGSTPFGIYGAHKEKKWALIVFFAGLVLGGICLLLISIIGSIGIPMAIQKIDDVLYDSVPLDEASSEIQACVTKLQRELKCCGAFNGSQDWGTHVPYSCFCSSEADKCEKITVALYTSSGPDTRTDERLVYKEPCGPILISLVQYAFNIFLGVCIGFAFLVVIGMVMSMTMICQIRRRFSPVTFTMNPSQPYTVLQNTVDA